MNKELAEGVFLVTDICHCCNCRNQEVPFKLPECFHLVCDECVEGKKKKLKELDTCVVCSHPIEKTPTIMLCHPNCDEVDCVNLATNFCTVCGYLCQSCDEKHSVHRLKKFHSTKKIDENLQTSNSTLKSLNMLNRNIDQVSSKLLKKKQDLIENTNKMKQKIEKFYDDAHQKLEDEKEKSLAQLNSLASKNGNSILSELEKVHEISETTRNVNEIYQKFQIYENFNQQKNEVKLKFETYVNSFKINIPENDAKKISLTKSNENKKIKSKELNEVPLYIELQESKDHEETIHEDISNIQNSNFYENSEMTDPLQMLENMGFSDRKQNLECLLDCEGDVSKAVEMLMDDLSL
eukprot:gene2711-3907_t